MRLCGARRVGGGGWYCTREPHDGEHIATVGPYAPDLPVLARWVDGEEEVRECAFDYSQAKPNRFALQDNDELLRLAQAIDSKAYAATPSVRVLARDYLRLRAAPLVHPSADLRPSLSEDWLRQQVEALAIGHRGGIEVVSRGEVLRAIQFAGNRQGCVCACCDHGASTDCGCECHSEGACAFLAVHPSAPQQETRVLALARDMASYVHHSGFPKYDGGHSEPESACSHPDCVAVRVTGDALRLLGEQQQLIERLQQRLRDAGVE